MHRTLAVVVTALASFIPGTALAKPQEVTGGQLVWTQANVYDTGSPAGTNRTWLGYVTSVGPPFTNGTMDVKAPATGASVTPSSERGADRTYPVTFPVEPGGTFDPETGKGSVEFKGTVGFTSSAHGFSITLANPKLALSASSSQLFASGQGQPRDGAPRTYDRSKPVFNLAAAAKSQTTSKGQQIDGLAPAIATAGLVWDETSYPAGAGPERTPNTFGSFSVVLQLADPAPELHPKATCSPTRTPSGRPRLTCVVTGVEGAARVVAMAGGKRLGIGTVKGSAAKVVFGRGKRAVTFKAVDGSSRVLAKRTQTVGG